MIDAVATNCRTGPGTAAPDTACGSRWAVAEYFQQQRGVEPVDARPGPWPSRRNGVRRSPRSSAGSHRCGAGRPRCGCARRFTAERPPSSAWMNTSPGAAQHPVMPAAGLWPDLPQDGAHRLGIHRGLRRGWHTSIERASWSRDPGRQRMVASAILTSSTAARGTRAEGWHPSEGAAHHAVDHRDCRRPSRRASACRSGRPPSRWPGRRAHARLQLVGQHRHPSSWICGGSSPSRRCAYLDNPIRLECSLGRMPIQTADDRAQVVRAGAAHGDRADDHQLVQALGVRELGDRRHRHA